LDLQDHLIKINIDNLSEAAKELLSIQKNSWLQCSAGYLSLDNIQIKNFEINHSKVYVQFNPGRITSTSARVDPKSIGERKCILCPENLPADQKGILYKDYIILCNPFPIFPEHFTIASTRHFPQNILGSFADFVALTKDLSDNYIVFYNGPKCGASAPDHLHFQAGTKDYLPLIKNYNIHKERFAQVIYLENNTQVSQVNDGLRKMILIEGDSSENIQKTFSNLYIKLEQTYLSDEEPLMNIIGSYENNVFRIIIILREKHRSSSFYDEGEKNMMISPAAVDLGGIVITPLEKDFIRINKEDIIKIFNEVVLREDRFRRLIDLIK
jgi:hypothetical protein